MQQENDVVGFIYGDVGSTDFNFAVNGHKVKKFDYITAPHKEGEILAQVIDIKQISDLKFDEATSLMVDEEGPEMKTKISAFADVIGYRDKKGLLQSPRTPFNSGSAIKHADENLIKNVLGLSSSKKDGAYIGLLKGHDLPVYLNIDSLVQKHICILAKTGGGKSYACGVLVEELLKQKIPMVIIDTHGEYASLSTSNKSKKEAKNMERFGVEKNSYEKQIKEFSPVGKKGKIDHLTMNGLNLEAGEITDLLPAKLTGPQKGVLYQAIKEVKEYKEVYTLEDIKDAVSRSKSNARWNVIASLESLASTNVFSEEGTPPDEIVKKGRCSIINMKGVPPDVQSVVVARLTKELFEERKSGNVPPFLMVVEEAHNYCPERGFGKSVSSGMLRTVASEGRKFGMGLCIVSQRPAKVDKNIISQCNTHMILKVTNPNDIKAIVQSVEGLTTKTADEIQRLPVGIALISGSGLQMPIMTEIRTRETKHGGGSIKISSGKSSSKLRVPTATSDSKPIKKEKTDLNTKNKQNKKKKPTKKAINVSRVANRLGWVSTDDANEAMEKLTKEAEKMNENVYKYLQSLARLGKDFCHKQNPDCSKCPMNESCNFSKTKNKKKKSLFGKIKR
ncbi:MAG: DUF87 domain-containing protein [Candidatus Thermoplasmatota archaeon]